MNGSARVRFLIAGASVLVLVAVIGLVAGAFNGDSTTHGIAAGSEATAPASTTIVSGPTTTVVPTTTLAPSMTAAPTPTALAPTPAETPTTAGPPPPPATVATPHFSATPGSIDLTATVGHQVQATVTITNDGQLAGKPGWDVSGLPQAPNAIGWNDLNTCLAALSPGGSCQIQFYASPSTPAGHYSGTLTIRTLGQVVPPPLVVVGINIVVNAS